MVSIYPDSSAFSRNSLPGVVKAFQISGYKKSALVAAQERVYPAIVLFRLIGHEIRENFREHE
ncbi:MAG: hypothetical protein V8Q79_01655 [Christensenellales bacterium]